MNITPFHICQELIAVNASWVSCKIKGKPPPKKSHPGNINCPSPRDIGAMTTTGYTEYDLLGRVIKQIDVLDRETATDYSADSLTFTVTTPAGATFVTTSNPDGSTKEISGTGQRAQLYSYDINGKNIATTVRLMDNAILSQSIVNGFGQQITVTQAATDNRFIYTRSEYNAKGQMVKQYQDTGWNTEKTAATLYEYESFGKLVKQTLALDDTPTKDNSPMVELSYAVESLEDGVYSGTTQTRYNAEGGSLHSTQKQLISKLSETLASKSISTDVRGNSSVSWSEYSAPTKITSYNSIPSSEITAETINVDGFTISQKDHVGIVTTATRNYTASGMTLVQVDGRGNATTFALDLAGRTISVTDAAGAITTTVYDIAHDQPSVITDAMGNTSCYKYDLRGRKIAEWGTALQPACFDYDEANHMTMLMTFRGIPETNEDGSPSQSGEGAAAGDETTWTFDPATGLESHKTYADNSSVAKTYDRFNRLATETDARGIVKTHNYEIARGLQLGTTYSDGTTARQYAYNHLGQLTQVTDDAGMRTIGYNAYGEQETDSLLAGGVTHLVTETRDAMGRSTGFTYAKNGTVQHTVTTGYGTDGRIVTAGFMHGGSEKQFSYGYLPSTNLLQSLTMPCNMTLTQSYETQRNLLIGMAYHRGSSLVTQRTYSYDTLGRPLTRNTARNGQTVNDTFAHNSHSELVAAQVNGKDYEYAYDNIGNRTDALEESSSVASRTAYTANELNQYTSIQENENEAFFPVFDADGNQTLVKTSTGIWHVEYNAENRPIRFTCEDEATVINCTYDSMGRRATKKVTTNGSVTLHQCYIYRGYLQIACCDLTRSDHPSLWLLTWDPTQSIATRPLAIRKDGSWFAYGWDLTKNICEVFGPAGYIRTAYTYTPFGEVSAVGDVNQSLQWSSENRDSELDLTYYNYRYYNAYSGCWLSRDPDVTSINNLYNYCNNKSVHAGDYLGANLYAVDGTWSEAEDNSNVYKFFQRTYETKYYWRGPYCGMTGLDASRIWRGVRNQICNDYCKDETISINLIGWSRGATIVMETAEELEDDGCCCNGVKKYPKVNWMGLYDAVDMTITWGWSYSITSNVKSASHIMKSNRNIDQDEYWIDGQTIYPTTSAYAEDKSKTNLNAVYLANSSHGNVGVDSLAALSWMTDQAFAAGVSVIPVIPKAWKFVKR